MAIVSLATFDSAYVESVPGSDLVHRRVRGGSPFGCSERQASGVSLEATHTAETNWRGMKTLKFMAYSYERDAGV